MKIRLICRCGCEGEWSNDYSTYVIEESEKWREEHKGCLMKSVNSAFNEVMDFLGFVEADILPANVRKDRAALLRKQHLGK